MVDYKQNLWVRKQMMSAYNRNKQLRALQSKMWDLGLYETFFIKTGYSIKHFFGLGVEILAINGYTTYGEISE